MLTKHRNLSVCLPGVYKGGCDAVPGPRLSAGGSPDVAARLHAVLTNHHESRCLVLLIPGEKQTTC